MAEISEYEKNIDHTITDLVGWSDGAAGCSF
jgi:hypothetical protein